ncbi:MAG TPA: sensor histidine kinase [Acidimicrobiales bacterium]|nr:sensor histidine kinase [Acidimicrobiales bacterium]
MTSLLRRARLLDPWIWDTAFAVLAAVFCMAVLIIGSPDADKFRDVDALHVLITLGVCATLAFRRRHPLEALVVASVLVVVLTFPNYQTGGAPTVLFFLLYAVALHDTTTRSQIGLAVVAVGVTIAALNHPPDLRGANIVGTSVSFAGAWIFGTVLRNRRDALMEQVEEAEQRASIEAERHARAVAEERLRIAQELHDVVAHSMSVIAVQAGVGAHVLDSDPIEARRALEHIATTSRSTLNEMRRLLGVLRNEDGSKAEHAPAPRLEDLPALVAHVEASGVAVDLTVERAPCELPTGVSLSTYRIVQEALTNVLRHAGTARAHVDITYEPGTIAIEVSDDGRGLVSASAATNGAGHGIAGMRERVAAYGGSLYTGPRPGGGFVVRARIPFEEAECEDPE